MATTYALSVVTPEHEVLRCDAELVIVRGGGGEIGVMARHIPLVTSIEPSVLQIKKADGDDRLAITGGFLEVRGDAVTVLARTAERAEDIDKNRALEAKERAEARLAERQGEIDEARAKVALARALVRLQLVEEQAHSAV